jgi:hypothetical protein
MYTGWFPAGTIAGMEEIQEPEAIRSWARKCADATRGLFAESEAWDVIAANGQEWSTTYTERGKPRRGGPLMAPKMCFYNSARTVLGLTAFDPEGFHYAEGFALSGMGFWIHHGWIVNDSGLVIDRTWRNPGERYIGVTIEPWKRTPGLCQLSEWPLGMPYGPSLADHPEMVDWWHDQLKR